MKRRIRIVPRDEDLRQSLEYWQEQTPEQHLDALQVLRMRRMKLFGKTIRKNENRKRFRRVRRAFKSASGQVPHRTGLYMRFLHQTALYRRHRFSYGTCADERSAHEGSPVGLWLWRPDIKEEDFLNPDIVIQLGVEPNRIDLLTAVSNLTFREA